MTATLKSKRETLRSKPTRLRAPKSSGTEPRIDPMGGFRQQGIIRGVSIVTRGEALGHYMWLDADFLKSVAAGINAKNKGVKARFTHPGLSSDGLGTFLGRVMTAKVDGDQVIADLHFCEAGHNTPDGDLAKYVMDLAKEDPTAFGVSIVFSEDIGAEDRFEADHEDEDGYFHSPDKDNTQNLPHARLSALEAADVVDEPAANPDGFFHREQHFAQEADQLVSYAIGLTSDRPATTHLGLDADRTATFVARFLDQHGLTLTRKDEQMANENTDSQGTAVTVEQLNAFGKQLLSKVDEKLSAFGKPAVLEEKEGPSDAEIRSEERARTKDLTNLFSSAGLKDSAILDGWIDKGVTLTEAKAQICDLHIKQNKLVGDDDPNVTNNSKDPKAKYRAEFRENMVSLASMGITDEEQYIHSRMVDEGQAVLVPGVKPKPAA